MRRALVVLVLGLLGCGPPTPTLDDEVGDESSEGESSSEADSSSESTSESTSETTDETTTDEATTDETGGECPTHSHGMLEIDDTTDLDTLACLVEAQWVYIEGSFTDLSFLSALELVETLHIQNTPQLVDLSGLDSLQQAPDLRIYDAPSMVDLGGLPADIEINHLYVGGDVASLQSIAMPANGAVFVNFVNWQRPDLELLATASPAPLGIGVHGAPLLEDLDDIAQCCLDQQAQLGITLSDTPLLTDLQGLEPITELRELVMYGNPEVVSLAGLQNLEVIEDLELSDHCDAIAGAKLADLHGLEQLVEVGYLRIWAQGGLVSLAGLPTDIAVDFATILGNPMLDQALVDAWFAAAMPGGQESCDNLNGVGCRGNCPQ